MRSVDGRLTARAQSIPEWPAALVTYDTEHQDDYQLDPQDGSEVVGLGETGGQAHYALTGLLRARKTLAARGERGTDLGGHPRD